MQQTPESPPSVLVERKSKDSSTVPIGVNFHASLDRKGRIHSVFLKHLNARPLSEITNDTGIRKRDAKSVNMVFH